MVIGAAGLCAVGTLDDIKPLRPRSKFLMQVLIVALAVFLRPHFTLTLAPWPFVGSLLIVFFLLATVNAFNLIDGLDGLSAGVGITASLAISGIALTHDNMPLALDGLAIAGSLAGFLAYNFHPASIFMGDCGALPMGFLLGAAALQAGQVTAVDSDFRPAALRHSGADHAGSLTGHRNRQHQPDGNRKTDIAAWARPFASPPVADGSLRSAGGPRGMDSRDDVGRMRRGTVRDAASVRNCVATMYSRRVRIGRLVHDRPDLRRASSRQGLWLPSGARAADSAAELPRRVTEALLNFGPDFGRFLWAALI